MVAWLHKGDETVPQYELLPTATKQVVETKGQKAKLVMNRLWGRGREY